MVGIRPCYLGAPHLSHNWEEQSPLPFGHRQYYRCPGIGDAESLDDNTPPAYDCSIQKGGKMSDAVKVLRKEIARSKIEEGTVVRFDRTLLAGYDYARREMSHIEDGKVLTYAAVFVNDRWYLTGKGALGNEALTNRDFVDRLSRSDISNIEVATAFESVSDDDTWG